MDRGDNLAFSLDLAVHHECGHVIANARDGRMVHCIRMHLDPERGWEGGTGFFDAGANIPEKDDGDRCESAIPKVPDLSVENQTGTTDVVIENGKRVPKFVIEARKALTSWDVVAPVLFYYAAGQAAERLRAMQLHAMRPDQGSHIVIDVMATVQTSMDLHIAELLSRHAANWTQDVFAEHWAAAENEAVRFLSEPSTWPLFLHMSQELLSKHDGSREYFVNWWGLSESTRQHLKALGSRAPK